MNYRELLKDKKRVVIKVGSSSLIHKETNKLDLRKLEVLVRELSDLHNQGKDVVLVTSGAVAVGASAFGMHEKPTELKKKQERSDKVLAQIHDGSIILLHDAEGNTKTVEALDLLIPALQQDGYTLVTVSQLFEAKGVTPDTHAMYSDVAKD